MSTSWIGRTTNPSELQAPHAIPLAIVFYTNTTTSFRHNTISNITQCQDIPYGVSLHIEIIDINNNINQVYNLYYVISYDIHIDNIENVEIEREEDEEFDSEYEESEMSGCGCCDTCSGEEGCNCGCEVLCRLYLYKVHLM